MPAKLEELKRLWIIEATKFNVLPLDDRRVERFNPDMAGRPQLIRGNSQLLFDGMGRLSENSVLTMKNKSFSITAELDIPAGGGEGVIIAQGGAFGGQALYMKGGKAKYAYNYFGLEVPTTEATQPLAAGRHQIRMEFRYDGGGLGKGGTVSLFYDGKKAGEGRIERSVPMAFSADETTDIGRDSGTPVSPDYTRHASAFNGTVKWVQIDLDKDDHDHLISPEERLNLAMSRQ
jgi:arylsulfatase